MDRSKIGVVVGLRAEARLLRRTGFLVEIGGGTPAGAAAAAARLIAKNVSGLLSFGLAGGLNPKLLPGAVIIPQSVIDDGKVFRCDSDLLKKFGGASTEFLVSTQHIAETADEKYRLFERTNADAVDLESGAVAQAAFERNFPFAVLRAVADPAGRDLPPAAMIALNALGEIKIMPVLVSVFRRPGQISTLLAIAKDAAKARTALIKKLTELD